MKVAVLQQYLRSLVDPLVASGVSRKTVEDIQRTCQELEPFQDKELGDLASFLKRAQEYEATGHWSNGSDSNDIVSVAKRLSELKGTPRLEEELRSVKKLSVQNLKALCKAMGINEGSDKSKPEILERILSHLEVSRTPAAVDKLNSLKALAESPNAAFHTIESELADFLDRFDEDEMIRIARAFRVILTKNTRKLAVDGIRRKVLETKRAKELVAY
jgi:hypothetical protein